MPQEQLTKEDEKTRDNLRNTAIVGLAGLLGIPVAEAGRKQVVGAKILKMMERGDLGKDFLAKGGKSVVGKSFLDQTKQVTPDQRRVKTTITGKDARQAALDPALRQQIHDLVASEVQRLKKVTSGITQPITEAISPTSVNKSARRKFVPEQKKQVQAKQKQATAAYNARVKRSEAAKAAAAAKRIDAEISQQVIGMNRDAKLRGTGIAVNETISKRIPELGKERRRLIASRNKLNKELGEKPKRGRTQASRDAAVAWDAKQQQVKAIDEQIAKLDALIVPSGQLRVNPQLPITELPGAAASIIGRMPGTEPTSTFFRGGQNVPPARQQLNQDITDLGRLQRDVLPFGLTPPNFSQPQGSMSIFTDPANPNARGTTTPFPGAIETQRYFDVAAPGTPQFTPQQGPMPEPSPTIRDRFLEKYDPAGYQAIQDQFTEAMDTFNPANVNSRYDPTGQTKVSPAERTGRIMRMAAEKQAGNKTDPTLIDRILKMFNVTGNVSPEVAANIGSQATVQAKNAVATKAWQAANPKVTFDPANPQHVEQLAGMGWQDPLSVRQTSAISNAANNAASVGDIKVPRTRLGMNAAAADAGRTLGLKGTQTFNPDLKIGDVNLGKLNKWMTGGSIVGTGAMLGYNYLRGKGAEKDAAASAKDAPKPASASEQPDALQAWALKKWNSVAGRQGNEYQKGEDIYNAVVNKVKSEGWWQDPKYNEKKKKIQSFWMTFAKQRDGGK